MDADKSDTAPEHPLQPPTTEVGEEEALEAPYTREVKARDEEQDVEKLPQKCPDWSPLPYREHWERTAEVFVHMLLEIYWWECIGGQAWMEGMHNLIKAVDRKGRDPGFDQYAGNLLRDHHIANMCVHPWKTKYTRLVCRFETLVAEATKSLDLVHDWTFHPGCWGEASRQKARKEGAVVNPPFGGFCFGQRSLLFVGLPLTLYLSDCPHLYTLVRRMRALAVQVPGVELNTSSVRQVLDEGDRPYAVLCYALFGSLQVLNAGRLPKSEGGEGLEGLCATAVSGSSISGWMSVAADQFANTPGGTALPGSLKVTGGKSLIFRGIWVPEEVDHNRATYSWSFNSFSRSLEGVLSVLDFYSSPSVDAETAVVAKEHSHVLLYVARWRTERWAFPVQLYNSGAAADTEKEVLVPPFVEYLYESGVGLTEMMEVSTADASDIRLMKLRAVEERWGMKFDVEAPLLRKLLKGKGSTLYPALDRALRVTVRFVKRIEPAPPVLRLLAGDGPEQRLKPEDMLLGFRAPENPVCLAGPHFISEERLGAGVAHWHDFNMAMKAGDKDRIREMQNSMAAGVRTTNAILGEQ